MNDRERSPMPELTEASTSRFVQTKKWRLHFNEAGNGHPVILLHGTGPGATGWSNFFRNIGPLSANYRVIALDLPGWGLSDACNPLECVRQEAHSEAVVQLMDELRLDRAALIGNSMGGAVGLQFAVDHTARLSHLITMGSGIFNIPNALTPAGWSEGMRVILEAYKQPTPANFRRLLAVMAFDASIATEELATLRANAAASKPEHLENWLKPFTSGSAEPAAAGDIARALSRIDTPSLFIHGKDDRVVGMEFSLRLLATIKNSQCHLFNRCGHWAQIEHADSFNALVHSFLSAH